MVHEAQALVDIVVAIIHKRRSERRISPGWVATEAMVAMDPDRVSIANIYLGCHLQLRQIARSQLRLHFEESSPSEDESAQHELFPDLQWRYPAARSKGASEPEYVTLEEMSDGDFAYNVSRLRREGRAKLRHADTLEAHWQKYGSKDRSSAA